MSLKGQITTTTPIDWNESVNLVRRLYKDGDIKFSLLIAVTINLGLKVNEIRTLKWNDLLLNDEINRNGVNVMITNELKEFVKQCYDSLGVSDMNSYCFISNKKSVMTVQWINRVFKQIKKKYDIKAENFSSMSFRKTFGVRYLGSASNFTNSLSLLQSYLGHLSVYRLCDYLGLDREMVDVNEDNCIEIKDFLVFPKNKAKLSLRKDNTIEKYNSEVNDSGYCYIAKNDWNPMFYKIGFAEDPEARINGMKTAAPAISLYKVIKTDTMRKTEKKLHNHFSKERVGGEWFRLTAEQLEWLVKEYGFEDYETVLSHEIEKEFLVVCE